MMMMMGSSVTTTENDTENDSNKVTDKVNHASSGRSATIHEAISIQPELENTLKQRNAFRDSDKFYRLVRKPNGRSALPTDFTDVLDFRCPENNSEHNRKRLFKVAIVYCKTHDCPANSNAAEDWNGAYSQDSDEKKENAKGKPIQVKCFDHYEQLGSSQPQPPTCKLEWKFLVENDFAREWQAKPEPGPPLVNRPKSVYKHYPGSYCLDAQTTQDDLLRSSSVGHEPFKGPSRGATMWAVRGLPGLYIITHALSEFDQLEWSLRAYIQHSESEHNNITNLENLKTGRKPGVASRGPCGSATDANSCQIEKKGEQSEANCQANQDCTGNLNESIPTFHDQQQTTQMNADLFVNACSAFLQLREVEKNWAESIARKEGVLVQDVINVLQIESQLKSECESEFDESDESGEKNENSNSESGINESVEMHLESEKTDMTDDTNETSTYVAPSSSGILKLQRKFRHLRSLYLTAPELIEARSRFNNANTSLKELRWTSLGFHYDWTMRSYHEASKSLFPATFRAAAISLVSSLVENGLVKPVQPEAGIVNYYPLGTQMGAHIDDAEPAIEQPIVSVSLGAAAIFLIGTHKRTETPSAMYLRSGDAIIMDGPSRLCFHAVPRIIENSLNEEGLRAASTFLLESYKRDLQKPEEALEQKKATLLEKIQNQPPELADCFKGVDSELLVESLEDSLLPDAIGPALSRAGISVEDAIDFLIRTLRETRINMNIRQVNDGKYGPPSTKRLKIPAEAANCGAYAASDETTFHKLCEAAVTVSTCAQRKAAQVVTTSNCKEQ